MAGLSFYIIQALTILGLALPGSTQDASDHQTRAQRWLQRHDFELPQKPSFDDLLARTHTRIDLGIFEVFATPQVLADPEWLLHIQKSLTGLLELQSTWIDWIHDDEQELKQFRASQKVLGKWIDGLAKRKFKPSDLTPGEGLIEVLRSKDKDIEASAMIASFMRAGGPLGGPAPIEESGGRKPSPQPTEFPRARLILAPSREDFVELTALLGVIEKDQQPYFWIPGTDVWTHLDHHGARIIAFEFGDGSGDYHAAIPMTYKNPRALSQHVVQLGSYALFDSYFGEKMEPMIAGGLASDMVIAIYDEADTRIDGDLRARSTSARSMFVPGGNPDGGLLPPSNAQSRWREHQGKGYFVSLLKQAQFVASEHKENKDKLTGFELRSDRGAAMIFRAPILGSGATDPPTAEFRGDYLEFLRAYRSAFLHWLVNAADGSERASRRKFSEIMRALVSETKASLPELFEAVYKAPLSAPSSATLFAKENPSLEGRFLIWLSKQK